MKKLLLSVVALSLALSTFGQAPEGFKYQAVVRDASNSILANQAVGMRITIKQGSPTGTTVYSESFASTSNAFGLINLAIGSGTVLSGTFAIIDWSNGPYYIETASDLTGGTTYSVMGTSQLMSVPYALYAKTSGNGQGPAGPAGADGLDGATGPAGPAGATGLTGATGPAGANGLNGATGQAGPAGANGLNGATGPTGPAGATGLTGPAGANGNDGATGPAGPAGSTGPTGATGVAGSTGAAGPIGSTGAAGATGPAGSANISGTTNYVVKFTGATTGGNSVIQDNGTVGVAITPEIAHELLAVDYDYTAGTAYDRYGSRSGIAGSDFNVEVYEFGVSGHSWNDYTRCGGVLGAQWSGGYWGSLGYKNSGSLTYGVYGTSGYVSGAGFLPTSDASGFGGGFFGVIGAATKGSVIGQLNAGELFSTYNSGNTYTLGKNVELVGTENNAKTAVYAVSSTKSTIYTQGIAQLVNGTAVIPFDGEYKSLLGENPVVTVTPNGNCNGVYIASVDKNGFTVKEMNGGSSTVAISWISVGTRIDNRMEQATAMVTAPDFDRNIQQVLFNDANKDRSGMGIWWDGTAIQFGVLPTHLTLSKDTKEGK